MSLPPPLPLSLPPYLYPRCPPPLAHQDTGVSIVRGVETVYALIDDHLVKIQMILSSPYVTHIERQCRAWEQKLLDATSLLESWMACQRSWLYLEPIFGSKEILRQMPKEGRKFAAVDALWRRTMQGVEEERKVMDCIENSSLYTTFDIANAKLEEVQKGLNECVRPSRGWTGGGACAGSSTCSVWLQTLPAGLALGSAVHPFLPPPSTSLWLTPFSVD